VPTGEIDEIRRILRSDQYPLLLRSVAIDGLRGFRNLRINFSFPVVAIAGANGTGKTTLVKAAASAYAQLDPGTPTYFPSKLFVDTPWDSVTGVRIEYAYKHGESDRTLAVRKPSARWRGMPDRPKRHVFLFDISRTMPIEALAGYGQIAKRTVTEAEAQSETLDPQYRERLSAILGYDYVEARYAVPDVAAEKRVGVPSQDFGGYSQFHQGAGEATSHSLISILQSVPDNSLLVIDEVEASLHPKAQRRLVQDLLWISRTKRIQVILTTHSPYVLEELPEEARILLLRGREGIRAMYGASPEFSLSAIDDRDHPELSVFCEDREAELLISELVLTQDSDLHRRLTIVPVGPANVVENLGELIATGKLPYPSVAVLDGDKAAASCLSIPSTLAPEVQVFNDLKSAGWPEVDARFGIGFAEIADILEDAMRLPDHHDWTISVGNRIRRSRSFIWHVLAALWVQHCVEPEQRRGFTEQIRVALEGSGQPSLPGVSSTL
jgi:predicted ATPase